MLAVRIVGFPGMHAQGPASAAAEGAEAVGQRGAAVAENDICWIQPRAHWRRCRLAAGFKAPAGAGAATGFGRRRGLHLDARRLRAERALARRHGGQAVGRGQRASADSLRARSAVVPPAGRGEVVRRCCPSASRFPSPRLRAARRPTAPAAQLATGGTRPQRRLCQVPEPAASCLHIADQVPCPGWLLPSVKRGASCWR